MDVNKDPPLQDVTQPSTTAAQQEREKRNRKQAKKTKVSPGKTEVELHRWRRPSRNRLTAGGDRDGGGVKQVCVYSLEVDFAAAQAGS